MNNKNKSLIALCLLLSGYSETQAALPSRQQIDNWLESLGGTEHFDSAKTIDWGVLPGPFYTPELKVGLGIAVVGLYRPDKMDTVSQHSSINLSGFISSTGAFGLNFSNYSFFADDRWRLFVSGSVDNMPTYYWGTGYQAGKKNRNREKYTLNDFSLWPKLFYQTTNNLYLGVGLVVDATNATDLERDQSSSLYRAIGGTSVFSSGVSSHFIFDSRDFIPNSYTGQVFDVTLSYFDRHLGSDLAFRQIGLQYASYYTLDESNVLAWEIQSQLSAGETPWNMQPYLSNGSRMRGYYEGRYRDSNILSSQVELRHKFAWRHGGVVWAGAGTLSEQKRDLGKDTWLPTVGVGYRFEFKPRMNVRLDLGIGQRSSGFYFQVGEAF